MKTRKTAVIDPAAVLAETRERVKAAKKVVKNAKAALKSARRELKEAKQARNVAEARSEAQPEKRAARARPTAVKTHADAAPAMPKVKRLSVRRVRVAGTPPDRALQPLPANAIVPESEQAAEDAVPVIESGPTHA